jgi:hypothetical protein
MKEHLNVEKKEEEKRKIKKRKNITAEPVRNWDL